MTSEEQTLLAVMRRVFTDHPFDIPCIIGQADFCPELMAAIEAAIPNCCRKVWRKYPIPHERLRDRVLRPFFTAWAGHHCSTDEVGWWYLKDPLPHSPLPSNGL